MNNVIVYTTNTWPWCHKVKDYLREHNIEFQEANVGEDREAAMEMVRKSGQTGVPVIDINGRIVVGFDQETIDNLLGLSVK